jgi:hypothetical protein
MESGRHCSATVPRAATKRSSRASPRISGSTGSSPTSTKNVVVCGHTHIQFDRTHSGKRVINAGSVGLPRERTPGGYWTLLGPDVIPKQSRYDMNDAARRIRTTAFPEVDGFVDDDLLKEWDPDRVTEAFEDAARPERAET